jgi:GntR family transcriptional regulator, rspAB operon transcriptional repressor
MLLRDNVYQAIRRAIVDCELHPGQQLREQTLASKYRVSRSPVRDALLRLELERLVTVLPRQGYVVNPVTVQDCMELYGLRRLIEPACASAAANRPDSELLVLGQFRRQPGQPMQFESYPEYHRAFHQCLATLEPNRRLAAITGELIEETIRAQRLFAEQFAWSEIEPLLDSHEAIINAIQRHDADGAFNAVVEYIDTASRQMVMLVRSIDGLATMKVEAKVDGTHHDGLIDTSLNGNVV